MVAVRVTMCDAPRRSPLSPTLSPEYREEGVGCAILTRADEMTPPPIPIESPAVTTAFRDILLKICRREDLTRDEAREAFLHVMSGTASESQIAGLLVGLAAKGTTAEELIGAAAVMREKAVPIGSDPSAEVILDTCGTGGDVRGTFNISTAAALVGAAGGVKVVKHRNRSASSKSGSADVLERLGVRLELQPGQPRRCLDEAGFCFAFAISWGTRM